MSQQTSIYSAARTPSVTSRLHNTTVSVLESHYHCGLALSCNLPQDIFPIPAPLCLDRGVSLPLKPPPFVHQTTRRTNQLQATVVHFNKNSRHVSVSAPSPRPTQHPSTTNMNNTSIFSSGKAAAASLKSAVTSSTLDTSAFTATALPPVSWIAFTTCSTNVSRRHVR